jgi:diguanylate cyclase (GGDEF)-like protein
MEYLVKPGKNTLGRKPDNHIVISDESASRLHAEIYCQNDLAILYDLGSLNGTFVNRERITKPHILQPEDQIRIGQYVISLALRNEGDAQELVAALSGTRPLTRDLLLESIDQHAVFLDAVASRLTMILDLESALQEISELTRIAVAAEKCRIVPAEHFEQLADLELPAFIARQAIEQRSVVIIPDLSSQSEQSRSANVQPVIRSVLCVPVMVEEGLVALIYTYKVDPNSRPFDRHDVQLVVTSSRQAGLTIQRAQLLERARKLEQLAITDSLTGLHNRRQILDQSELEFQRAQRFHRALTVLMLDLDDLKQINDTYGHQVGDQALRTVADKGRQQLREVDSIGRLGGDEFVIALAETDLDGGRVVAERIRQSINDTPIITPGDTLNISTTIGMATMGEKTATLAELLSQADSALMKAKKAGKNQIAVAE